MAGLKFVRGGPTYTSHRPRRGTGLPTVVLDVPDEAAVRRLTATLHAKSKEAEVIGLWPYSYRPAESRLNTLFISGTR